MNSNAEARASSVLDESVIAQLQAVLYELNHLESLCSIITANECTQFFSMSRPQKADLLTLTSEKALEARCLLSSLIN